MCYGYKNLINCFAFDILLNNFEKLKRFVYLFLFFAFIFACGKKKALTEPVIQGFDYYPTTPGKYVIYDVDSILYIQLPKDTLEYKYRIKEKISDTFTDKLGRAVYRLERYIKKYNSKVPYDSMPWTIKEAWQVNADTKNVQVVEDNNRFTKLIFPVRLMASWDGNAYNTLGSQIYEYEYIDRPEIINSNSLNAVLKVNQFYFRTAISLQNYCEKYARGIGLVYREMTFVVNRKTLSFPIENNIDSGMVYRQSFVSYGKE